MEKIRISKLMSERGMCSRREADEFISKGLVYVNGVKVTELGTKIDPSLSIALSAHARKIPPATILLNKPVGFVSNMPEKGYKAAISLISAETRFEKDKAKRKFDSSDLKGLAVAGRLDIDSTGLLVLTQDGRIAKKLIGENSEVEKEYLVRVTGKLSPENLKLLNHGLELDGEKLKPARVSWQNEDQLRFVLKEGKKRQIRRMCELAGLKVLGLKRVRIGRVKLGDLPAGKWRYLSEEESF